MYVLTFVLPVAFVAHDVLQVLVALYVFGAYDVGGLLYHVLGQSRLACYLYGERRTGAAYGELEEGLHLVAVVEHGCICHALMAVGKVFQVLVVGGNDTVCLLLAETVEHSFGYGSAYARFGACAKLVDENDGITVGSFQHVLHVEQVRGVGGEVVLQTLLIAYVYHDVAEHACP